MKLNRLVVAVIILQALAISCAWSQMSGVVETKLDNGLVVLTKEVHAAPVFTAQVWFKVGSRNEHTGITGISHLLEHMLFNSSKNYKKGEISNLIRKRGGIENASTSMDFTFYWQLLSSKNLEFSLKTLAERVGNALLDKNEFASERTVVLSELQGHENDPDWKLYHYNMATAFMAHPYQWPVIGWESDVRNIDVEQVRDYYQTHYYPNNATLVLVGDFDTPKALTLIKKYFGSKPKGQLPRPVYTTEPPQKGKRDVVIRQEGSAERVMLTYHIPAMTDPDSYPLMVLDRIMSGGRASRLYQAMVETRLATSASSAADISKDPNLFFFEATGQQKVSADTLEKEILTQIEKAKTTLPTDDEIQAAKNQLEADLIFQNDSVTNQGRQLGYYSTLADWHYLENLIPNIKAVTAEDVQSVAVKYLTRDNMTKATFIPTNGTANGGTAGHETPDAAHLSTNLPNLCYYNQPGEDIHFAETSATKTKSLPAPTATASKNIAKPFRTVMPNGIVLIVQENHSNPTVAVSGYIKAGSYFDPDGKSGTASLVGDMLGRGTSNRSALDLAKEVEFVGASVYTSANIESMSFGAKSLTKDFSLVLDILSDELRHATFPEDQFEKSKGEMVAGLEQSRESTEASAFRAFRNSLFPAGHPYHSLTIEQAQQQLTGITRDDLVKFYNAYYRPDTTIITIAGDVTSAEATTFVTRYFGDWSATGPTPVVDIPTIQPQTKPEKIVITMADKSEVSVVYGYALGIKRSDPDFYAARVMNQVLGGGGALGSILGTEIRQKRGLVYDVRSTFDASLGAGPWYASLGTNPKDVDEAVKVLRDEMEKMKTKGVPEDKFVQARDFIIGVFPISLETNEGVARTLLSAEFYNLGMDYLQNYADLYQSVTLDQVNAAAKKYLHPENGTLVIAGP
ncbi:MAG: pitrilysin family protein [Armatimonadota bacterium]|nr:insulinase family protein [bacterium]